MNRIRRHSGTGNPSDECRRTRLPFRPVLGNAGERCIFYWMLSGDADSRTAGNPHRETARGGNPARTGRMPMRHNMPLFPLPYIFFPVKTVPAHRVHFMGNQPQQRTKGKQFPRNGRKNARLFAGIADFYYHDTRKEDGNGREDNSLASHLWRHVLIRASILIYTGIGLTFIVSRLRYNP